MGTSFKNITADDVTTTRTLLHENIPLTGTLVSGTYGVNGTATAFPNEENIKNYSHGMFQSVYDYPYLSSSANHIFDITVGYSSGSAIAASTNTQHEKKRNIYNQMAQVLMGNDVTGAIQLFDEDGDITGGGTKLTSCVFLNFSRLLTKDEIKKGETSLQFLTGGATPIGSLASSLMTLVDASASTDYRINSPAGEYGILYQQYTTNPKGLIYYQAGIAVLTSSVFSNFSASSDFTGSVANEDSNNNQTILHITGVLTGSTIRQAADCLRHRVHNISFNNTTELNSTIYFCRANHNEFNYSSNPTYLSASKVFVKENNLDVPVAYATTVGLYSADNELMAVAKLSEPLKKTPNNEMTLKVRLDY
tara:strand:- start:10668 stop:11759 length:1092 start_codon:yes stop_codon:yes gene_type:complete